MALAEIATSEQLFSVCNTDSTFLAHEHTSLHTVCQKSLKNSTEGITFQKYCLTTSKSSFKEKFHSMK